MTEKNSEGGGTFDASGAFHGASEHPEEEEPQKRNENVCHYFFYFRLIPYFNVAN